MNPTKIVVYYWRGIASGDKGYPFTLDNIQLAWKYRNGKIKNGYQVRVELS